MASTGKKGRKSKGTVISLQSFLSNGMGSPVGTTQVTKKVRNLEADDSDDSSVATTQIYQLPTAPRANRVLDDSSVPQNPPFLAFITNLPFDIQENDFQEIFASVNISSVRIPRDDGEGGRIRGFGYVEFHSRDDLIYALSLPDPQIKGRRIRIDVSNGNESSVLRLKSNRRAYDGFGNINEGRDSSNWRENSKNDDNHVITSKAVDRNINRDTSHSFDDAAVSWRSGKNSVYKPQTLNRNDQTSYKEKCPDNGRRRMLDDDAMERPKLYLKPRSLPLPCSDKEAEVESFTKSNELSDKSINDSIKVSGTEKNMVEVIVEGRIIEVKRNEKTRAQQQKDLQTNGDRFDAGFKDFSKLSQNCTLTNWRNSVDTKSVRKNEINSHVLLSESGAQGSEGILQLKNSNRIERLLHSTTPHENEIKTKTNSKSEGNMIKTKNMQSEPSVIKSSNKYSELAED